MEKKNHWFLTSVDDAFQIKISVLVGFLNVEDQGHCSQISILSLFHIFNLMIFKDL